MNQSTNNRYILPTAAGAYFCASSSDREPARDFLQQLMSRSETLCYDTQTLTELFSTQPDIQDEVLYHLQKLKFLQTFKEPQQVPPGTIEASLPDILQSLSSDAKVLLADSQGFYLSSAGFTHEAAEELSALSGDLASLYSRHQGIIKGNLNINSSAFALVDASGYSQLGFWPVYIGELLFMLVVSGVPRFDQANYVNLIWTLHKHYFTCNTPADSDAA